MQEQDNRSKSSNRYEKKVFKDYEIFAGKVRLVRDGQQPIVIDRDEAIELAKAEGKNLVQIAYNKNDFPRAICKAIDYGKFLYEQKQKEKLAKKKARENEADIKEVCFSIRIDDGDFMTKVNHIKQFLGEGDKVKLIVKLLRREMNLKNFAMDMMKKVISNLEGLAEMDQAPSGAGNLLMCTLRPVKK